MSLNIPRDIAKQTVIDTYKRTRRQKTAADAAGVPYATARRWLHDEGLIKINHDEHASAGITYVSKGPDVEDLTRVDREPCFKCGVRRDVGCKHHPKEAEPERAATPRDKAEALWSVKL